MNRRQFITLLGGAAAWPVAASGQQSPGRVIGYLHSGSPQSTAPLLAAFLEGLQEADYIEGRNLTIEYRWAWDDLARLPGLASDLVSRRVAVLAAPGSTAAALAAKAATTTIPIVFSVGIDPVQLGLVASLSRPGANITGVNSMSNELGAKRLQLLYELVPVATRLGVLVNPKNPSTAALARDVRAIAITIGREVEMFAAANEGDIDTVFVSLIQKKVGALVVHPDVLFIAHRRHLAMLAAHYALPVIWPFRTDAEAGGLMSYGVKLAEAHRQAGIYCGRILKGANPAELPVVQPTRFELIINLKTARALGLTVPVSLLARADEVIE